jgi:hypothetical protein
LFASDHAVCKVSLLCASQGTCLGFGGKWDVPNSLGCVSLSLYDDLPVFDYVNVVFGEEGDAVVITELAD